MMIPALFTEKKTAPGRIPGEKCSTIDVVDAADETDAQRRPQKKKRVPGIQNFVDQKRVRRSEAEDRVGVSEADFWGLSPGGAAK